MLMNRNLFLNERAGREDHLTERRPPTSRRCVLRIILVAVLACLSLPARSPAALVSMDPLGRLIYQPDENGNRIPDFSHCGFMAGGRPLPFARTVKTITPKAAGDDRTRIQQAINEVSGRPPGPDGMRGAILLRAGRYRVSRTLHIAADGVVLRGEGRQTVMVATGKQQRTLIIVDSPRRTQGYAIKKREIVDTNVPMGARSFRLANVDRIRVGNRIQVERRGNSAWIKAVGMDRIPPRKAGDKPLQWKPFSLVFDREVTAVAKATRTITIDAPLGERIEKRWGGGSVSGWEKEGRLRFVGVENLHLKSAYDPSVTSTTSQGEMIPVDENHCNLFIKFENVIHSWARKVTMADGISGITLGRGSKWITVRDCRVESFVSQITGGRRYGFTMEGNLGLVMRCHVTGGRHGFVVGSRVPGPNAFVYCATEIDFGGSEPHHRWSAAGLYDNVNGTILIQNRANMGSGHGWSGANYVVWNCRGTLTCQKPPTAQNYAFGHVGKKEPGHFARSPAAAKAHGIKDGYWESRGRRMIPDSLFVQQFIDRLGVAKLGNLTD
jgi:hypothetical protein